MVFRDESYGDKELISPENVFIPLNTSCIEAVYVLQEGTQIYTVFTLSIGAPLLLTIYTLNLYSSSLLIVDVAKSCKINGKCCRA